MCLIVFSYREHSEYRLILAANRDEFYARPTDALTAWSGTPGIIAGRDKVGGGTWLGITRSGRFAAITNYRDPHTHLENAPSRGRLVADYLRSHETPRAYMETLRERAGHYQGFSLLAGNTQVLYYFCNFDNAVRELAPGTYGVSNHLLDTPWPKVRRAKKMMDRLTHADVMTAAGLLDMLMDTAPAADEELPDTGVGLRLERDLSPVFITGQDYGTRASTVLLIAQDGRASITERSHPDAKTRSLEWRLTTD